MNKLSNHSPVTFQQGTRDCELLESISLYTLFMKACNHPEQARKNLSLITGLVQELNQEEACKTFSLSAIREIAAQGKLIKREFGLSFTKLKLLPKEGKAKSVNRILLLALSPVIRVAFSNEMAESASGTYLFPDLSAEDLTKLMKYIKTGGGFAFTRENPPTEKDFDLLQAMVRSHFLGTSEILNSEEILRVDGENLIAKLAFAHQVRSEKLLDRCHAFIETQFPGISIKICLNTQDVNIAFSWRYDVNWELGTIAPLIEFLSNSFKNFSFVVKLDEIEKCGESITARGPSNSPSAMLPPKFLLHCFIQTFGARVRKLTIVGHKAEVKCHSDLVAVLQRFAYEKQRSDALSLDELAVYDLFASEKQRSDTIPLLKVDEEAVVDVLLPLCRELVTLNMDLSGLSEVAMKKVVQCAPQLQYLNMIP